MNNVCLGPRQSSVAVTFCITAPEKGCYYMRIITWNCNMAFARKREAIMALKPDIILLSEVSQKDIETSDAPFAHWIGNNPHKGLGIIGIANHQYKVAETYTDELPWFLPIEITDLNLHLLGVWAHVKTQQRRYVRVTHEVVDHYRDFLTDALAIMAGDFNSNTIWDKLHPGKSHSLLVEKLHEMGLNSLYHRQASEAQGTESTPTQYMYRKPEKGYHIDFVFIPESLSGSARLEIGSPDEWLTHSDHMPMIVDVKII